MCEKNNSCIVGACASGRISKCCVRPGRLEEVGYVVNFMSHEWYQNIIQGAQHRAKELGVDLRIADADNNVAKQITHAENMIA